MKVLITDDDFVTRSLMNKILSQYAECDVAVSGEEAILAFKLAYRNKTPYHAIYLDIIMPGSDGYNTLKSIREFEKSRNIGSEDSVKIIMVSGVDDPGQIMEAFKGQCEAYIVKPIKEDKIIKASAMAGIHLSLGN